VWNASRRPSGDHAGAASTAGLLDRLGEIFQARALPSPDRRAGSRDSRKKFRIDLPLGYSDTEGAATYSLGLGFAALKSIGYDGWVTIELYPFQQNSPEVARRAYEHIKPLVG